MTESTEKKNSTVTVQQTISSNKIVTILLLLIEAISAKLAAYCCVHQVLWIG